MNTTQLKKIYLSADMMTATDISSYAETTFIHLSGDSNVGNLYLSNDISVAHNIVAEHDTGIMNDLVVGHNTSLGGLQYFNAKQSLGVHENTLGARGIYWKAIDTTEKKIYLTSQKQVWDPRSGTVTNGMSQYSEYDRPYFGPKAQSQHPELFSEDSSISLNTTTQNGKAVSLVGKCISLNNNAPSEHTRLFKVVSISGSVITYEDTDSRLTWYYRTLFRRANATYWDNEYTVWFPEVPNLDQAPVAENAFGCFALGDGNIVMGCDSLAVGLQNQTECHYATAIGYKNCAQQYNSIALGGNSTVSSPDAFVWNHGNVVGDGTQVQYADNGYGTFNINPKNGLSGFYIGQNNFISCVQNVVGGLKLVKCTQEEYDALVTKDLNTLYVIIPSEL